LQEDKFLLQFKTKGMKTPKLFLRNYFSKLHHTMININLESISIYADAECFLKEMFNPRSVFYAITVAWDCSGKVRTIYGNLPLQLSYNDTRRYQGEALKLFSGQNIHGGLNLCIFAYRYEGNRQDHKKFLRKLDADVQHIFIKNDEQTKSDSPKNIEKYQTETSKNLKHSIEQLLKNEHITATNIFEGRVDINDLIPNKNLSTINHYRKMGGFRLSVTT